MSAPRRLLAGRLAVVIHPDRAALGQAAADAVAAHLRERLATQGAARVIFACAPSQDEFLAALVAASRSAELGFDWAGVTAFHMDDYVGFEADHPRSFRRYLRTHLLDHVAVGAFHPLPAELPPAVACARYAALLAAAPIDLICLGIGENGHLAFNDPPVADFDDPVLVKVVGLDDACRRQQVNDGCFPVLAEVPTHALTLTLPVFRDARRLSVHVPGPRKAAAVRATLREPRSTACPATLLRDHPAAILHVDEAAAARL
ncbi:glucosamine-6-phosphate deaminase [Verrucomicrobiota bacterium]|nr:glucosamine-6-phosphate deaminase [Verrucomicrobiota bacterium]GDY16900.1 glucosamine-6-phosphate deaminase [Verrucomicrobiota bacterium]